MYHKPPHRPACHTEAWPVSRRAPGFWDDGAACGTAMTVRLWLTALDHTPSCFGCRRALRGLLLEAADNPARQAQAFALTGVPQFRYDLKKEPA
jgi:hypothetical protein